MTIGLSEDDIRVFISKLVSGEVSEAQLGAWLMATCIHGLNVQETAWLTRAMVGSGVSLEWPEEWRHLVLDKHSTGGVGDKVGQPGPDWSPRIIMASDWSSGQPRARPRPRRRRPQGSHDLRPGPRDHWR